LNPLLLETRNKGSRRPFAAGASLIEHPDATREDRSLAAVGCATNSSAMWYRHEGKLREVYVHARRYEVRGAGEEEIVERRSIAYALSGTNRDIQWCMYLQ